MSKWLTVAWLYVAWLTVQMIKCRWLTVTWLNVGWLSVRTPEFQVNTKFRNRLTFPQSADDLISNILRHTVSRYSTNIDLQTTDNCVTEAQLLYSSDYYYLRQVNEVNGGDNAFVRCVCLSVCLCVHSGRSWELNANISKTVKATDFKFETHVPRDSPDMTAKIFPKGGVARVTWPPKFLGAKC